VRGRRKRLVLYSGGQERRNALIHSDLLGLSGSDGEIRMTYVPFCGEGSRMYFARFKRRYRAHGATRFDCVPVDDEAVRGDPQAARRILRSDIVYLAGGNTFYFLKHLRRSGLAPVLRQFVARGGVLAGLSAGAILMTPNIGLAGYPPFDRDENDVDLRDLRALGLVTFEFFPHFVRSRRLRAALADYSRCSGRPLYACRDGSAIVIEDDLFTAHGDVTLYHRGHEIRISH